MAIVLQEPVERVMLNLPADVTNAGIPAEELTPGMSGAKVEVLARGEERHLGDHRGSL